jgi:hypothetical protein
LEDLADGGAIETPEELLVQPPEPTKGEVANEGAEIDKPLEDTPEARLAAATARLAEAEREREARRADGEALAMDPGDPNVVGSETED